MFVCDRCWPMKITAITRFKEGVLYGALKQLGWTQKHLSEKAGWSQQLVGRWLNLKQKPNERQCRDLQSAFGEAGVFIDVESIWPENFTGFSKSLVLEQTAEVSESDLIGYMEYERGRLLGNNNQDREELLEDVQAVMESLPNQKHVQLFIKKVDGGDDLTMEQIGEQYGIGRGGVHHALKSISKKIKRGVEKRIKRREARMLVKELTGSEWE